MKKIGLALGGGAVRGFAHVGVMKALKKHQIPIDFIAGTSIGGAIGGLVAAGIDIEEIEEYMLTMPSYRLVDIGIWKRGILTGNKYYSWLIQLLEHKGLGDIQIENLNIPFRTVAVDLKKGRPMVFDHGSLSMAIRATSSMPGLFAPVNYENKILVDGGVLNNLPADLPRAAGMDVVIAVDVEREHEEADPRSIFEVLYRSYSIMTTALRRTNLQFADVVLRPEVGHILALDFGKVNDCIRAGERETERKINEIKRLLV